MLTPVSNQPNPNGHVQHNRCCETSTASKVNGLSACDTLTAVASVGLITASIIGVMTPLAAIVGTITLLSLSALCCGTGPSRVGYVHVRPAPVFNPIFFGGPRGYAAPRAGAGFAGPGRTPVGGGFRTAGFPGGHGAFRTRHR